MVHCFCVGCSSAVLGDLLGVSRSVEYELPSVLFYRRFFSSVFYTVSFFFLYYGCLILLYVIIFVFCVFTVLV